MPSTSRDSADRSPDPVADVPVSPFRGGVDVLTVTVDGTRCGIPLADVDEIVRAVTVTPLPGAPAVVEGIIDVRGALVPVFDTRRALGRPARAPRLGDHLVVVRAGPRPAALRVDHADAVTRVDEAAIEDPRPHLSTADVADVVAGVARLTDGLVVIHDVRRFLSDAEVATLERALTAEGGPA